MWDSASAKHESYCEETNGHRPLRQDPRSYVLTIAQAAEEEVHNLVSPLRILAPPSLQSDRR